jgi:hypothetical protein
MVLPLEIAVRIVIAVFNRDPAGGKCYGPINTRCCGLGKEIVVGMKTTFQFWDALGPDMVLPIQVQQIKLVHPRYLLRLK